MVVQDLTKITFSAKKLDIFHGTFPLMVFVNVKLPLSKLLAESIVSTFPLSEVSDSIHAV